MKTTGLDFYTSKNFLATEKGQDSISILEKDITIEDKIKRIGTLLKIDITCKDFNIDNVIQKISNEYNAAELIKGQLEGGYKLGNPSISQKYHAIKKIADEYELIYYFLDDAKKKLPSMFVDHNKIARFQTLYSDMVKQANDIKKFLDRYEKLDIIYNMKEIGELANECITKTNEYERLINSQIPKVAKVLKKIDEKYKKNNGNAYIRDLLNHLNIGYNSSISIDFYQTGELNQGDGHSGESVYEFKHKENIIEEMFVYLKANNIPFYENDIILDQSSPTVYIYVKGIDKTIVISNLYGVGTHVYPGKVSINEIENNSIQDLMQTYKGKRLNFVLESGMQAWKQRFVETISDCQQETIKESVVIENIQDQTENANPEIIEPKRITLNKTISPIQKKITTFFKGKEDISIDTIQLDQEYHGLISSIKGDNVFVWIGGTLEEQTFGHLKCFNPEILNGLKCWNTIKVKLHKIYPEGSIQFKGIY